MATSRFSLNIVSGNGVIPEINDAKRESVVEFAALLKQIASGGFATDYTLEFRNSGVRASAVVTCATVVNGNTVTLNGTALTATQHHSRGTLTLVSAIATDVAEVGGVSFVGQASAATLGTATFDTRTSNTAAAASLVAQINSHATLSGVVTATSAAGVVTVRAVTAGVAGDLITISSPDSTITASAATLSGGAVVGNNEFDFGGAAALNNTQTATALAAAINASSSASISRLLTATSSGAEVTISATYPGIVGNYMTIASSGATLAITGSVSRLAGGTETFTSMSF